MGFKLAVENELVCRADGSGSFFAKKGAMIADRGSLRYEKRLLGTNQGGLGSQLMNHITRKITGENLELMEISGNGTVYLADQGAHCILIDLEPSGPWRSVCVESEDLLAFTPGCHYGVKAIGTGVLSQKGMFTSELTYETSGAQVVVKSQGNPLILEAPCRVDPDALIAWTGESPQVTMDMNWKSLIGHTSGESYFFEFRQAGQIVVVQPFERNSGLNISVDDRRYTPQRQS